MLMSISPSIINSPIDIIFIIKWMIGIDINSIRFFHYCPVKAGKSVFEIVET